MKEFVNLTIHNSIGTIEFFHPQSNALPGNILAELANTIESAGKDNNIKVIILKSAGDRAFCAGASFDELIAIDNKNTGKEFFSGFANVINAARKCPKFIIGRVQGKAVGGGVGLACVCDYVIASSNVKFGFTETRLGLIPSTIGPYVVGKMGQAKAREVFMSGNIFSELDAKKLNIVSEISDDLDQSVEEHIIPYLKTAPKAVGEAKALVRSLGATIDDKVIEQTIQQLADIWEGEEARHGIESFLNKTKPRWSN